MMQALAGPSRPRVLVVDDEPMLLELIVTRLELAGFHTYTARNGREALRRLREVRPDAMLLDITMPELDGLSVLAHLQESTRLDDIPTMVLTARNQRADVQRALTLGARDYLAKPFRDDQLIARLRRILRRPPARPAPEPEWAFIPES